MSYTAIEKMRAENRKRFGKDVGPFLPKPFPREARGMDMKSAVLRFLDRRCTDLRHDPDIEKTEKTKGYQGSSLRPNQIPYNMQMDLDRLCLKNEIAKFIDSGVAEDAYTVYYSFIEMFIGQNGKSQSMVELLSEFESNASSLLMSHRDHYSHSVYVFALGLAIFETNEWFRKVFSTAYRFKDGGEGKESACAFLEYWGLTALFHDIGYPFEIPFEQILAYFEVDQKKRKRGEDSVYLAYRNVAPLIRIGNEDRARLAKLYNGENFEDVAELLAFGITQRLGKAYKFTGEEMDKIIRSKPTHPEKNNCFMDHAFFSACRLYQELVRILKPENLQKYHVDALTAIMLHNSLFKFAIVGYKSDHPKAPLKAKQHPLAWMLMLCDELQCWDRTAYGRNSRNELHPMAVDFSFADQQIRAMYYYDKEENEKVSNYNKLYKKWEEEEGPKEEMPRLKAYSDMAEKDQRFRRDIGQIVDLKDCPLTVECALRKADRQMKHTYLSSSNFLHIYNFAVTLHNRYLKGMDRKLPEQDVMEKNFNSLSLEYKISNINQVRSFDRYLDAIDCFYTDQPVDYEMLSRFTDEMVARFAPMEHERWVHDHQRMGWTAGNAYETVISGASREAVADLREQFRMHRHTLPDGATKEEIVAHYNSLPPEEQDKDSLPFNSMLKLLKKYDGVRIYRLK
jgi:hypothetical protein